MAVATLSGTMLVPGVSLNRRLYTKALIGKAVERMQARLADPESLPIVMRTHHGAGDDSRLIVGRITSVKQEEDGSATYEANLYGTQPGRDIADLVAPKDGSQPALKSVSISGGWLGPVKTLEYQGQAVTTGDDLAIDAVDFTATPGVLGALISKGVQQATESASERWTPISENYEATVTITETTTSRTLEELEEERRNGWLYSQLERSLKEKIVAELDQTPYGNVTYADPGKQKDRVKRYPLDTKAHVRAAWSYINMPKNAAKYSSSDLAAIKGKIKAAMKRFGIKPATESNEITYGEIREYYPDGPSGNAGLCIDAYAGPLSITFRASCLDASSLKAVGAAAMDAATNALAALDPDTDGDIDVPGAPLEDDDNDMESAPKESAPVIDEQDLKEAAIKAVRELRERYGSISVEDFRREILGEGTKPRMDDPMTNADDDAGESDPGHNHTHDMEGAPSHTHGHSHTHESADGSSYDHDHGHTHSHLPGGEATHAHGHDHTHTSHPDDTHENHEKEIAVSESEKTPAAEAAPAQPAVALETVNALAQSMAAIAASQVALAEAVAKLQAAPAQEAAPVAPVAQEAAPVAVPEPVAEAVVTGTVVDEAAMEKRVTDRLRDQILREYGIPQRHGYRTTENDHSDGGQLTPEQEVKQSWDNRTQLLLGNYGLTPTPIPGTGIAAQ